MVQCNFVVGDEMIYVQVLMQEFVFDSVVMVCLFEVDLVIGGIFCFGVS